jgi:hypothetical protein
MEVCSERPLGLTSSSSENDLNNDSFSFCNKNSESDTDESRTGDINNEVNLFENSFKLDWSIMIINHIQPIVLLVIQQFCANIKLQ